MGCHFLLQCIKVESESEAAQSSLLATPWTSAHQAPPSMGFFQARILEWGAITFSEPSYQGCPFPCIRSTNINSLYFSLFPPPISEGSFLPSMKLYMEPMFKTEWFCLKQEQGIGLPLFFFFLNCQTIFFKKIFLNLFLAVLGLHCFMWTLSSWGEQGPLRNCSAQASHCSGFSCC